MFFHFCCAVGLFFSYCSPETVGLQPQARNSSEGVKTVTTYQPGSVAGSWLSGCLTQTALTQATNHSSVSSQQCSLDWSNLASSAGQLAEQLKDNKRFWAFPGLCTRSSFSLCPLYPRLRNVHASNTQERLSRFNVTVCSAVCRIWGIVLFKWKLTRHRWNCWWTDVFMKLYNASPCKVLNSVMAHGPQLNGIWWISSFLFSLG